MMKTRWLALVMAAVLAACASGPRTLPAPGPAPTPPSPLATEEKWLREWFNGTPVQIGAQDDGALRVTVPIKYAFDPGQDQVKPALGAVLDKVATSLRRQPGAKLEVAAPADEGASAAARTDRVRDYLAARGVRAARVSRGADPAQLVEMRLLPAPKAIERLNDPQVTGSGTRARR